MADRHDQPLDTEELSVIKDALDQSERVDSERIRVALREGAVVLQGSVAEPAEATAAEILVGSYASDVVNELRIDEGLREGREEPADAERTTPAENEILIGETDMLPGPEAEITSDLSQSLEENEPWNPPDEPSLAPTPDEYKGDESMGDAAADTGEDVDPDYTGQADKSAPDLSREELAQSPDRAPALDPSGVAEPPLAEPDPAGVDEMGRTPPEELEPMADQVPGTPAGPGATGEGTAGGGSISGTPGTETGSVGGDNAPADPAKKATGGTSKGTATERGPQAREDPPLREDYPDSE